MRKYMSLRGLLSFACLILVAGCASTYVFVPPTAEELEAVQGLHKTLAIIPVTENGTRIKEIAPILDKKLENYLAANFKVIDTFQVQQAMGSIKPDTKDMAQLAAVGKSLGADYVLITNANVSMTGPKVQYTFPEISASGFYAKVWAETIGRTDMTIKMLSTKDAAVVYSDTYWGETKEKSNEVEFNNLIQYNKAIDAAKMVKEVLNTVQVYSSLKSKHPGLVEDSMDPAVNLLRKNLNIYIVQTGEVLQVLPKNEILINLGSAYGLKPDYYLSVWREGAPIKDPKTGLTIIPKDRIAVVTIDRVTSGLSCVAKGKPKEMKNVRVGDKVLMN